ncbi:MAG: protein kinase [Acidobacteriaceae bacterium]|nr:protein kinase [Acidobacteriaceae bacterium]
MASISAEDAVGTEAARLWANRDRANELFDGLALAGLGRDLTKLLAPGELLANRYTIVRLIGYGGMGEVYEAKDEELREHVALKTIRSELSTDEQMISRLRREVLAARKVSHPCVCRVFHFEQCRLANPERTVFFLTMQLLEGETLGKTITGGPISPERCLALCRHLASALAAAHEAGVLHRDLKPANIIVIQSNGQELPVITDFGLAGNFGAKASGDTTRSVTAIAGTPDYMAPEQWMGGLLTPSADIFAFGCVAYEMLTGRKPFGFKSGVVPRWIQEPPKPSTITGGISTGFERVVMRSLVLNPEERFRSGRELLSALEKSDRPVRIGDASRLPRRFLDSPGRWPALVVLTCFLALSGLYLRFTSLKANAVPGSEVFLAGIENLSHDRQLDGATEVLRSQLMQSERFNLLDPSRVEAALFRMRQPVKAESLDGRTAREIAMREGAPLVISGSISRLGDDFILQILLERTGSNPSSPAKHWAQTWTAKSKGSVFEIVHEASKWLRSEIGESTKDIARADLPPESTTTASWAALSDYTEAEHLKRSGDVEHAIDLLRAAVNTDPHFAIARMRLADMLVSVKRTDEGYAEWRRTIESLDSDAITEREALRIRGEYAIDSGDWIQAHEIFSAYQMHFPNDYLGWFYDATALRKLAQSAEAVRLLKAAASKQPRDFRIAGHLAMNYLILGELDNAQAEIGKLRNLNESDFADYLSGNLAFLQGDGRSAEAHFRQLRSSAEAEWQTAGFSAEACLLAELNKPREAMQVLDEGIAVDTISARAEQAAEKHLAKAWLAWRLGDTNTCVSECRKAADLGLDLARTVMAGTLLAREGDLAAANRLLDSAASLGFGPVQQVALSRLRGEIALASHRFLQAVTEMQAAVKLDAKSDPHEYFAHALAAAGNYQEALHIYESVAQNPGRVWFEPEYQAPGMVALSKEEVRRLRGLERH